METEQPESLKMQEYKMNILNEPSRVAIAEVMEREWLSRGGADSLLR